MEAGTAGWGVGWVGGEGERWWEGKKQILLSDRVRVMRDADVEM